VTLAAMTASLSVRAEIRALCKQLLTTNEVVAGILMLAIITMIVVAVWTTVHLLADGLPPSYLALESTYDYSRGLEYCLPLNRHTITRPLGFHGCGCC
jgi:hypothetical protein